MCDDPWLQRETDPTATPGGQRDNHLYCWWGWRQSSITHWFIISDFLFHRWSQSGSEHVTQCTFPYLKPCKRQLERKPSCFCLFSFTNFIYLPLLHAEWWSGLVMLFSTCYLFISAECQNPSGLMAVDSDHLLCRWGDIFLWHWSQSCADSCLWIPILSLCSWNSQLNCEGHV